MVLRGISAVFFDAGHTLIEPVVPVPDVYLQTAWTMGLDVPEREFRESIARLWKLRVSQYHSQHADLTTSEEQEREAWRRFTAELAEPFPALAAAHVEWLEALSAYFDDPEAWRPVEGAEATVAALRDRGVLVGVVSNWHGALHAILEAHPLRQQLKFVLTSAEVGHMKPHRRIFEQAIRLAGASPESIAHVGDSWEADVLGARGAGVKPVYVTSREPAPADADGVTVIARLADLVA